MAVHTLANHEDFLSLIHCRAPIKDASVQHKRSGDQPDIIRTYDDQAKTVAFEYPHIKPGGEEYATAHEAITRSARFGQLQHHQDSMGIDEGAPHLKVQMPVATFKQIFAEKKQGRTVYPDILIQLEHPVDILAQHADKKVTDAFGPPQGALNLDKDLVVLRYTSNRTVGSVKELLGDSAQAASSLLGAKLLASRGQVQLHHGVLEITMNRHAYQKLTPEPLPVAGQRAIG